MATERKRKTSRPRVRRSRNQKVSDKIALLVREGKPQKQAVAIAHSMSRRGEL